MVIKDIEYKIVQLGVVSALFGYALSFYSVYFFHLVIALFFIYTLIASKGLSIRTLKIVYPVLIFFLFSAITLLWVENIELGLINLFYIFCGFFAVVFSVLSSKNGENLKKIYKVLVFIATINFIIGFCESLGLFRLPMSPYSQYASFFGYKESDLNEFYTFQVDSILSKPTGFNGNPNTFGFVFILTFPFLFFYNKYSKYFSLIFVIFFNFYLQSRGVFIASIIFFLVFSFLNFRKNFFYFLILIFGALLFIPFFNYDFTDLRISSSFESIQTGFNNILNKNVDLYSNSTDVRASVYTLGIINLIENPILGLGLGGIQNILLNMNSPIQSFHFYFLEVLINYGIVFYLFFMVFYIKLILNVYRVSLRIVDKVNKNISLSIFYALVIMPFASIAPSSIVYNLTAWTVVGLALSIVHLDKEGKLGGK